MRLHKEGYNTLIVTFIALIVPTTILMYILPSIIWLRAIIIVFALITYLRIVFFFRVPNRQFESFEDAILSSADGEVVAIEEIIENEYLHQKCIQVSVFMSPNNVHINWMPASGVISYFKYHPGKHFIAWYPKSSTLNERTSIGLELKNGKIILIRQVAGALARRIVCYPTVGQSIKQAEEFGFIKFGSRVDLYLPLGTEIAVKLKDKVVGGRTLLAKLK